MAFPLHPETPVEGRRLEDLFAGQPIDIGLMLRRMRAVAAREGLPFGERTMTYNSRLAQEIGKWAESEGMGEAFHDAAFRAYFAQGRNLADRSVLMAVARSVGLDPVECRRVAEHRIFKAAVDDDWRRSRENGVTAVPTFVLNGRRIVGAKPIEELRRFLEDGGVSRR